MLAQASGRATSCASHWGHLTAPEHSLDGLRGCADQPVGADNVGSIAGWMERLRRQGSPGQRPATPNQPNGGAASEKARGCGDGEIGLVVALRRRPDDPDDRTDRMPTNPVITLSA